MSIFVSLPTILVGLVRHLRSGALNERAQWRTILVMAPGSIIGAVLGGLLVGMVPAQILKVGLGLILIWSAFRVFAHTTSTPKT